MTFIIKVDKEKCTGCGTCVALCPTNWELKEGKALPKKTEVEEIGCNQDAENNCPVEAIEIKEKK